MEDETKVDVVEEAGVVNEEVDIAGLIGELSAKIDNIASKLDSLEKEEEQEKVDDVTDDGELSDEDIEDLDKFLQG